MASVELGDFGICHRLMNLAADPDNQAFIIKEKGCMTGLVRYLDNPTVEVASMAARTIWLLSTCPGNRPALLAQAGLFDRLCKLNASPHEAIRVNAAKALGNLTPAAPPAADENTRPSERSPAHPSTSSAGAGAPSSVTKLVAPKAVTVKVDGLHSVDKRDALIKALLGVKGVTSVTVDQRKGVAIIYTYRSAEDIRGDMLEAVKTAEAATMRTTAATPSRPALDDVDLDYLDENDSEETKGDSAVAHRTGKVSLESRLAEKREKATAHQRKRDVVYSALGRVFGSFW